MLICTAETISIQLGLSPWLSNMWHLLLNKKGSCHFYKTKSNDKHSNTYYYCHNKEKCKSREVDCFQQNPASNNEEQLLNQSVQELMH